MKMILKTPDRDKPKFINPNEMQVGDIGVVVHAPKSGYEGEVIFRSYAGWHSFQGSTRYWPEALFGHGDTSKREYAFSFGADVLVRLLEVGEQVPLVRAE